MKKLICVIGETGAGKDTIINMACKRKGNLHIKPLCSYTTRPKRKSETDGVEHWFIKPDVAHEIMSAQDLLAYTKINDPSYPTEGYEYFTTLDQLKDENIYVIDPRGLESLMKYVHNGMIEICIIYIYTPRFLRRLRTIKRNSKNEFKDREANERKQFLTFRKALKYNVYPNAHKIVNLNGLRERSVNKFLKICSDFLKED